MRTSLVPPDFWIPLLFPLVIFLRVLNKRPIQMSRVLDASRTPANPCCHPLPSLTHTNPSLSHPHRPHVPCRSLLLTNALTSFFPSPHVSSTKPIPSSCRRCATSVSELQCLGTDPAARRGPGKEQQLSREASGQLETFVLPLAEKTCACQRRFCSVTHPHS